MSSCSSISKKCHLQLQLVILVLNRVEYGYHTVPLPFVNYSQEQFRNTAARGRITTSPPNKFLVDDAKKRTGVNNCDTPHNEHVLSFLTGLLLMIAGHRWSPNVADAILLPN